MGKLGILGGSFNPVHLGHKHLAESSINALGLDKIIIMPTKKPPHKSSENFVSDYHRLKMCEITFSHDSRYNVSDYEISKDETSYSIYTVEHLKKLYKDDEIYFLMGTDMLLYFKNWHRYKDLIKLMKIVVVARENAQNEILKNSISELEEIGAQIYLIETQAFPISSTKLRDMILKNEDCTCYMDKNVVQYIIENKLYR